MRYIISIIFLITALLSALPAFSVGPYIENSGTVIDQGTNLTWQQQTGDTDNDNSITINDLVDWEQALSYCENLSLDNYDDWRLPNALELDSLVDDSKFNPAITSLIETESYSYWAATTSAYNAAEAWYVNFNDGFTDKKLKNNAYYVRCVRNGLGDGYRYAGHIHQNPMYGPPGTTFTQSGNGFTPNSTVTLQFRNHLGELLTPTQQPTDATGSFSLEYTAPADKPIGTHSWWVVDDTTNQNSEVIGYSITSIDGEETAIEVGSVTVLPPIRQDAGFGTLTSEGSFDPTKDTFVIVHGWNLSDNNNLPDWMKLLGQTIKNGNDSPANGSNILYWNWQEKARGKLATTLWDSSNDESCMDAMIPGALLSPALAGLKYEIPFDETEDSGKILALAMSKVIPTDYNQNIHMIGHSLGSLVVSYATKFASKKSFHFSGKISHLILMDSPCYFGVPGSEFLENNKDAFFLENYISMFGRPYKAADVDIWLTDKEVLSQGPVYAHGYPYEWYRSSINNFNDQSILGDTSTPSTIQPWGFLWWQEENRLNVKSDYSLWNRPHYLLSEGTPAGAAIEYMDGKIAEWVEGYLEVSDAVKEQIVDYAQYAGKTIKIKAVNTYNKASDAADYVTDVASHAIYNSLGYITLSHSSDAILTMPVSIPAGANALSFGYEFLYGESGSMLEVFINDIPMHHVTSDHALGEGEHLIPWINVEPFAGQTANLSLRLSNSTEGTEGKVRIDDLIIAQVEQRKSVSMPWLMLLLK